MSGDNRGERDDVGHAWAERALLDRLNRLQIVLPALARDVEAARREAARLRVENTRLARSLADLECRHLAAASGHASNAHTANADA